MTNTIGIAIDTAPAKQAVDDFRASAAQMRGDFQKAQSAAEAFNEAVASFRRAALDEASDSLAAIARVAREAASEVKRLGDEMRAAGKPIQMKLLVDGRERVAGLLSDLRQTALAASAAEAAVARVGRSSGGTVDGGRLRSIPGQISGANPSQLRIAGPIIDVQPINAGTSAFQRLRDMALAGFDAVRQFGSSIATGALAALANASRAAGSALSSMANGAANAGLRALSVATTGLGYALYGVAFATVGTAMGLSAIARWGYNQLGGLGGVVRGIYNGLQRLSEGALNAAASIGRVGLGVVGLGGLSIGFLAKSAVETADAFTLAERKMNSLAGGSEALAAQLRGAVNQIADSTRSSLQNVTSEFNRLYLSLSKTGTGVDEVAALTTGLNAAMKLSGASADEAKRAMVQFAQGVGKGKLELQDMKSIAEQSPGLMKLMEEAAGKSMAGMNEAFKKGGAEAQAMMSRVVTFIANESGRLTDQLSQQPRTFEESVVALKNAWFNAVGAMQSRSDFMGPLNRAVDRVAQIVSSDGFQRGFASALRFATETAEQFVTWLSQIGSVENLFISIKGHLSQIGAYIRAAGKDIKEWATPDFSSLMAMSGPAGAMIWSARGAANKSGPSNVEALRDQIKRDTQAEIEAAERARAVGTLRGSIRDGYAPQSTVERGSMSIKTPDPVGRLKEESQKADRGLQLEKQMTERLNLMREETLLNAALMSGDVQRIRNAELDRDIEKAITFEMWQQRRGLAEQMVMELKRQAESKRLLETYNTLKGLGSDIFTNLSDQMMKVGEGTMKFRDAMRESLAYMIKAAAQAMIIKPLINQMSSSFGASLTPMFGDSLSKDGGGLLGGIFGGAKDTGMAATITAAGTSFAATVQAAAASFAATLQTGGMSTAASLQAAGTATSLGWQTSTTSTSAQEIAAATTAGTTETTAAGIAAGYITGAGSTFAATVASSGGGGALGLLGSLFAKGGAFSNGVKMFASGDVFSSPTAFGMSGNRMGIMGEAGPEAIMPLTRLAGGKLGVKASGSGGGAYNDNRTIAIHVAGDAAPETVERLRGMVRQELAKSAPGMTKRAVAAVRREHVASGTYLKR